MENPEDDPREYQQHMPGGLEDGYASGMDNFFRLRQFICLLEEAISSFTFHSWIATSI
jgi:hypothetical protein